jgi:TonB-dependent SusC/RagA subfamily outer membrane receptor
MKRKLLFLLLLSLVVVFRTFGQTNIVTGTITAKDDGKPLPGVSVKIKGSTTGTQSDIEGKFKLNAPIGAELLITYIGYQPYNVTVGKAPLTIVLVTASNALNEVVVTSLGANSAKKTLGYSQTTVKGDVLTKSASIDLFSGIQGKVAGMTVSEVSGTPGGSTKVILRGYSSIGQSNQPLYVIDGVPLDNSRPTLSNAYDFGNNANDVDPNNVESISILKGSEATALYGTRGSSGVILITTKKGKQGKPTVDFASSVGITKAAITWTP